MNIRSLPPTAARTRRPAVRPSVGVTIDLPHDPAAGGHVKCWQRLAAAAAQCDPGVDLTLYFLGRPQLRGHQHGVTDLGPQVRIVEVPPRLPSQPLTTAAGGVDATDLALRHPVMAQAAARHDLIHVTHDFALSRTAAAVARRRGIPLVASLHTDVPALAASYLATWTGPLRRLPGGELLAAQAGQFAHRLLSARRRAMLRHCDVVLCANEADRTTIADELGADRTGQLRRGVDNARFDPALRDRSWLEQRFGVPRDATVVLFAGRVDASKRAPLVARAVRLLRSRGDDVVLFCAGNGRERDHIRQLLGAAAVAPGTLDQADLARVYASCDLFAFPSLTETVGNVVSEAMSSGLPVLLPTGATTTQWLRRPGTDGLLVPAADPASWASAIATLVHDKDRRAAMSAAARQTSSDCHPRWIDVLRDDLLPVWHKLLWLPAPAQPGPSAAYRRSAAMPVR